MVLILVIGIVSGCSTKNNDNEGKEPYDNEETEDNNEKVVLEKEGTYVGLIDSNSIEIVVDGEPKAFRLTEEIRDYFNSSSSSFKDFKKDDSIKLYYYEDMSLENICKITKEKEGTIKSRLKRSRDKLKPFLKETGFYE